MKLPRIPNTDRIVKNQQFRFGGYNHTAHAKDGEIYDEKNVSSERFPLIEPRETRTRYTGTKNIIWKGSRFSFKSGYVEFVTGAECEEILKVGDKLNFSCGGQYGGENGNDGDYVIQNVSNRTGNIRQISIDPRYSDKSSFKVRDAGDTGNKISEKDAEIVITLAGRRMASEQIGPATVTEDTTNDMTNDSDIITPGQDQWTRTVTHIVSIPKRDVSESIERSIITYDNGTAMDVYIYKPSFNEYIYLEKDVFKLGDKVEKYAKYTQNSFILTKKIDSITSGGVEYDRFEYDGIMCDLTPQIGVTKYTATYGDPTEETTTYREDDDHSKENGDKMTEETAERGNNYNVYIKSVKTYSGMPLYETSTTTTAYTLITTPYSGNIISVGAGDKIYYVTADGGFWYDGVMRGALEQGEKKFCETGAYIYIIPDNAYYDKGTGILHKEHLSVKQYQDSDYGVRYVESQNYTEIQMTKKDLSEFVNRYVTVRIQIDTGIYYVKGTVTGISNDRHTITFSEELCAEAGIDYNEKIKKSEPEKLFSLTVSESFPELKFICAAANRIWGCDTETIFCTAFGKPFSWFEYPASDAGNDADGAWSVTPFAGGGEFTGACVYMGTPFFFTENKMYKIYGDRPGTFSARDEDIQGVIRGADKTLLPTSDGLFWLSREGVMRWAGGADTNISRDFGESFVSGAAGTDGRRVYFSLTYNGEGKNFLYDTDSGLWNREDETVFSDIFFYEGNMYGLHQNYIYRIGKKHNGTADPEIFDSQDDEDEVESFIEFGDHYNDTINKKCVSKLYFRMSAETGAEVGIKINYDSEKENGERVWRAVKTIEATEKRSFILPVIPRRCDHFRIRIEGEGKWRLHGMSFDYYVGSEI